MSYFLRDKDYNGQIREVNLGQVQVDTESRRTMELVAQAELASYLSNRYECDIAFAPLLTFSDTDEYKWQDRIDLTASAFSTTKVYVEGERLVYQSYVYERNATSGGYVVNTLPTNATYFTELGLEGVYFVTSPSPYKGRILYTEGTQVSYNGNFYERTAYETGETSGILPDNTTFWTLLENETIPIGTLPSNNTYWTYGDNRNQQLKVYMIDVCLYHLHSNINPRNIPQLRIDRYNNALNWCKMINRGEITANLPEILPVQGQVISVSSNTKLPQYF